ncbi:hypothetical protein TSUD_391920 [Trifolium subterraneum]|uniref:Reverse transcriptase zinc-binding domain-containing protein n=1 Tax=Trifolium subterraneum TaxID=3900 RepID=A0A2Z6MAY4_TRISU|nr:hypothetical protein TSUD_391920 [Trifolium subterraneum]
MTQVIAACRPQPQYVPPPEKVRNSVVIVLDRCVKPQIAAHGGAVVIKQDDELVGVAKDDALIIRLSLAAKAEGDQPFITYLSKQKKKKNASSGKLWAELTDLQNRYGGPWLFIGDFNAVLGGHEKRVFTICGLMEEPDIWSKLVYGAPINVKMALDEVIRIQTLIDENDVMEDIQRQDFHAQLVLTKAILSQDQFCHDKCEKAINALSKKFYAGNISMKVDIKKAFDFLDWNFLLEVLCQFGFNDTFCDWIQEILHSARLSILLMDQWAVLCRVQCLKGGIPVESYRRSSIWPGIREHVNKELDCSFCILETDPTLTPRIKEMTIPVFPLHDKLVWRDSKEGELTANQANNYMFPPQQPVTWSSWIRNKFVPPSTFIMWRCIHNWMPTDENLLKRDVHSLSPLPPDTTHVVITNLIKLWTWLHSLLHFVFDCTSVISRFTCFSPAWSELLCNLAAVSVVHVFHTIWMARNRIRFNNASINLQVAKTKILTAITKHTTSVGFLFGCRAADFAEFFCCRHMPSDSISVLWKTLSVLWIKANTDGSVCGDTAAAACGGLFRDHSTCFRGGFSSNLWLGYCSSCGTYGNYPCYGVTTSSGLVEFMDRE